MHRSGGGSEVHDRSHGRIVEEFRGRRIAVERGCWGRDWCLLLLLLMLSKDGYEII